jgi:hypothetical protein
MTALEQDESVNEEMFSRLMAGQFVEVKLTDLAPYISHSGELRTSSELDLVKCQACEHIYKSDPHVDAACVVCGQG